MASGGGDIGSNQLPVKSKARPYLIIKSECNASFKRENFDRGGGVHGTRKETGTQMDELKPRNAGTKFPVDRRRISIIGGWADPIDIPCMTSTI